MQRKVNKAGKAFRAASLIAGCVVATGAAVPLLGAAPAGATTPPTWNNLAVVAGSGGCTNNKAGAATSADLCAPYAVATDASGNFYIADTGSNQVDKVDASGQLTVIAGTGNGGTPTEGPATSSDMGNITALAVDSSSNVYLADAGNSEIYKVTPAGQLTIFAGTGNRGRATAGPATGSDLSVPQGLAVDASGNVYIGDAGNGQVEKVDTSGQLSIFAGTGNYGSPTAGAATSADFINPTGVATDASGNVYIADNGADVVVKVNSSGQLSIVAGNGNYGSPTAGPATSSSLARPYGIASDASGNLLIADTLNNVIEKVDTSGQLSIFAGTGNSGSPTAGPATSSDLQQPQGVAFDASGNVYIADTQNWLIEEVGAPPTSLYITSTALAQPTATFGHTYSTALTSKNGVGAVHWKVTAGALPLGVKLSSTTGVISGTPHLGKRTPSTAVYAFTVTATDSAKPTKSSWSQAYSLTVSK